MAITYKRSDDLEKMLSEFASFEPLNTKEEKTSSSPSQKITPHPTTRKMDTD